MNTTFLYRRLATFAAIAGVLLGIGLPVSLLAADFPPLNAPATHESHPGKFVWAELFTADAAAAAKFYSGVFGWTAVTLEQHGVAYTVLSNGAHPVAGLRQRGPAASPRASRWINYIAVADLTTALALVTKAGGEIRAPAREFPQLGSQAIFTDKEGSPVGLVQSASGDSAEDEPAPGAWNWFHLFVKDPLAAADFYRQIFSYEVAPDGRIGKGSELLLSSGSFNRGGVSALPDRAEAKPGWLGVIRVASLDETLARVASLGGEVVVAPHEAALGSRFAIIADPTGGSVGVVEYVNHANPINQP